MTSTIYETSTGLCAPSIHSDMYVPEVSKYPKVRAGARVTVKGHGEGRVWSVRPTVTNWVTGDIKVGVTVMLDRGGPNMVQSWPINCRLEEIDNV